MLDLDGALKSAIYRNLAIGALALALFLGFIWCLVAAVKSRDACEEVRGKILAEYANSVSAIPSAAIPSAAPSLSIVSRVAVLVKDDIEVRAVYLKDDNTGQCFLFLRTSHPASGLSQVSCPAPLSASKSD